MYGVELEVDGGYSLQSLTGRSEVHSKFHYSCLSEQGCFYHTHDTELAYKCDVLCTRSQQELSHHP